MVIPLVVAGATAGHDVSALPAAFIFHVNTPEGATALLIPVTVAINVIGEPNIDE